jgi:hypothetical protein
MAPSWSLHGIGTAFLLATTLPVWGCISDAGAVVLNILTGGDQRLDKEETGRELTLQDLARAKSNPRLRELQGVIAGANPILNPHELTRRCEDIAQASMTRLESIESARNEGEESATMAIVFKSTLNTLPVLLHEVSIRLTGATLTRTVVDAELSASGEIAVRMSVYLPPLDWAPPRCG